MQVFISCFRDIYIASRICIKRHTERTETSFNRPHKQSKIFRSTQTDPKSYARTPTLALWIRSNFGL